MNKEEIIWVDALEIADHYECLWSGENGNFRSQSNPVEMLFSRSKRILRFEYEETVQVNSSTRGGSRRTIMTEQIKDRILELMNDDITSLEEIKEKLKVDATIKTIWNSQSLIRPRSGNITIILVMNWQNRVHSELIRGTVDTKVFQGILIPTMNVLWADDEFIFVMGSVNFHHNFTITEDSNFSVMYLPPYSPMRKSLFVDQIECLKEYPCIRNPKSLNKKEYTHIKGPALGKFYRAHRIILQTCFNLEYIRDLSSTKYINWWRLKSFVF
ncbi:hypothetical protein RF11_11008 [Thelohanellus kitauei]|uniref:Tc1-like transposase DDE domain-containing protein n=1 Tax=Thelohanellus kitauei TaxID=669202 RepID=A0A0C2NBK0_THEKT|nr:hypothetical protein RF11_11008 [Thelohanellus kitauei]